MLGNLKGVFSTNTVDFDNVNDQTFEGDIEVP